MIRRMLRRAAAGIRNRSRLGPAGERIAADFLRRHGGRILARNYRSPVGEIDIIADHRGTLVFVEVKTRSTDAAADPEAAVNYHKRRQITRAARFFISQMRGEHLPARFDVLSIVLPRRGKPQIEHFVDAFGPTPR